MKQSTRLYTTLIIFILAALLVACQDAPATEVPQATDTPAESSTTEAIQPSNTDDDAQTNTTNQATDNTQASGNAQATLTILADELRAPILESLSEAFAENQGVTINVQLVEFDDLLETFKTNTAAGNSPDILIGPHDWLGELVDDNLVAPLPLENEQKANFLPSAISGFTHDGQLYGLPYAVENVAFFRNTDLVPEAPQTWSDVADIAATLESENKVKQGYVLNADAYHYYPIQTAFGGYIFGWDSEGNYNPSDVGLDKEESLAAARWLETMAKEGHLVSDTSWEDMHLMFEAGETAMLITGPWALERIRDSGIPYAISPLPDETQTSLPFVGIQGFMISASANNPDLAQRYLTDFILTEETMLALFETNLRPPAYLPTRRAIEDPDLAAFAAIGSNGLPMPAIPEMSLVWDAWEVGLSQILEQAQTADKAFQDAADSIRATVEEDD